MLGPFRDEHAHARALVRVGVRGRVLPEHDARRLGVRLANDLRLEAVGLEPRDGIVHAQADDTRHGLRVGTREVPGRETRDQDGDQHPDDDPRQPVAHARALLDAVAVLDDRAVRKHARAPLLVHDVDLGVGSGRRHVHLAHLLDPGLLRGEDDRVVRVAPVARACRRPLMDLSWSSLGARNRANTRGTPAPRRANGGRGQVALAASATSPTRSCENRRPGSCISRFLGGRGDPDRQPGPRHRPRHQERPVYGRRPAIASRRSAWPAACWSGRSPPRSASRRSCTRPSTAFTAKKIAGAAYLIWRGHPGAAGSRSSAAPKTAGARAPPARCHTRASARG